MNEKISIPTVANQFMRVEGELSTLKGLAQQFADHLTAASSSDGSMTLELSGLSIQITSLKLCWGPADDSPPPTDEDVPVGEPVEQPPTEAPEPRQAQHFDGRRWVPGPSPENAANPLDNPPGQG